MWYTGMWSLNVDQSDQWRSISMTSQWPIIYCDVTMSNDAAMGTYHGITIHNGVVMNLFFYVFSALCLIIILLWVVCNKNKNKFMFDQSGLENTWVVFLCRAISLVLWTHEISLHKHNSCVLPRLIKHSLVLIIVYWLYRSKGSPNVKVYHVGGTWLCKFCQRLVHLLNRYVQQFLKSTSWNEQCIYFNILSAHSWF